MVKVKTRQQRKTLEDTIEYQEKLEKMIDRKIKRNAAFNHYEEKDAKFLFKRGILSHGTSKFYYKHKDGKITRFPHISSFFAKLVRVRGNKVRLKDGTTGKKYTVEIKDLWKALRNELDYLFPFAWEDAVHMSAESYVGEKAEGRKLSLDEKIHTKK